MRDGPLIESEVSALFPQIGKPFKSECRAEPLKRGRNSPGYQRNPEPVPAIHTFHLIISMSVHNFLFVS